MGRLSSSSLVTVDLDGKEYPSAWCAKSSMNYIKRNLIHVDFQVVSLTEKIRANCWHRADRELDLPSKISTPC